MATKKPKFVRLEYWNPKLTRWVASHDGIALLHPQKFAERYWAKGNIARAVDLDTGELYVARDAVILCEACLDLHPGPEGICLT